MRIFEEANAVCDNPKEVSNWIMGELLRLASETGTEPENISFDAANLGKLIILVKENVVNRNTAKEVFEEMFMENAEPESYIKENNLQMVSDDGAVREVIIEVIAENPKSIAEFKEGNDKVLKFLMGQAMKRLKGKANPGIVGKIIDEELGKL